MVHRNVSIIVVVLTCAMVFAFAANANAAKGPAIRHITVRLQEFDITPLPSAEVKVGTVRMKVINKGSITHEMVLVRASSIASLPKVTVAGGERAVGAVDEEAIPAKDTMGETGDVKSGKAVTKTFKLRAGHYVMFCNIDDAAGNHFGRGMSTAFVVKK